MQSQSRSACPAAKALRSWEAPQPAASGTDGSAIATRTQPPAVYVTCECASSQRPRWCCRRQQTDSQPAVSVVQPAATDRHRCLCRQLPTPVAVSLGMSSCEGTAVLGSTTAATRSEEDEHKRRNGASDEATGEAEANFRRHGQRQRTRSDNGARGVQGRAGVWHRGGHRGGRRERRGCPGKARCRMSTASVVLPAATDGGGPFR